MEKGDISGLITVMGFKRVLAQYVDAAFSVYTCQRLIDLSLYIHAGD